MSNQLTKMAFEETYLSEESIEFAVRFDYLATDTGADHDGVIEFEHIDKVQFPIGKIDWLIDCLQQIKANDQVAQ